MEKLLLHEVQPKEVSQAGLVYSAAIYTVVCKEETTRKMDEFLIRSSILDHPIWTKNAIVICMPMNDKHRKAV